VPVDTTLSASHGAVTPAAVPGDVTLSDGGSGPLATLSGGKGSMSFDWPGSLPTPTLSGDTATYPNVIPNGDLVVTATVLGFEVSLKLRQAPASPLVINLPMQFNGLTLSQQAGGGLALQDSTGKLVAFAPAPRMFDSSTDPHSGDPAHAATVASQVVQTSSGPGAATDAGPVVPDRPKRVISGDD
jgi:hypothetical protein